ncbi:hypothetical protein EAI_04763 [Harpegnathos saltator]|uniref:Uncharacterized protein n=1 Tax=Harpegnathos saltator TaxID=610380 RepID=E2BHC5_HARSA|nr:hypothetical protein EAI_04763 [Harpegnathos saltator]
MPVPHRHALDVKKRIGNANLRTYDETSASSTALSQSKVGDTKERRLVARLGASSLMTVQIKRDFDLPNLRVTSSFALRVFSAV